MPPHTLRFLLFFLHRYVTRHADSVYATGYHMLLGGLMLLGALAAQDMDVITNAWQACTPTDAAILAYISVLGGAASYGVFFYNASIKGNLTALSSLTFLTCVALRARGGVQLWGQGVVCGARFAGPSQCLRMLQVALTAFAGSSYPPPPARLALPHTCA